jgi:hypothetical protein
MKKRRRKSHRDHGRRKGDSKPKAFGEQPDPFTSLGRLPVELRPKNAVIEFLKVAAGVAVMVFGCILIVIWFIKFFDTSNDPQLIGGFDASLRKVSRPRGSGNDIQLDLTYAGKSLSNVQVNADFEFAGPTTSSDHFTANGSVPRWSSGETKSFELLVPLKYSFNHPHIKKLSLIIDGFKGDFPVRSVQVYLVSPSLSLTLESH